jgi:membrane fusion protein
MQKSDPLFRSAALAAGRTKALGEIVLVRPLSFGLLTAIATGIACAVIALFVRGTYTKHSTLSGQLVPDLGVIRVHTPQYGTITEKRVMEGDGVKRGDVLYVISSERFNSALGTTQELISEQLSIRRRSLEEQIRKMRVLEQTDRELLDVRIAAFRSEIATLQTMSNSQQQRVSMAEEAASHYERIQARGFISAEQLVAKQGELLDQRSRLQGLQREQINAARQLADLESQVVSLPLKYQNQTADLERAIAAAEQEMTENDARRGVMLVAPQSGTASAVTGEVGQAIDSSRPLLSIVPDGATLQAQLYATSRTVGFIDVGDEVRLRYQAYPYQKFGHHPGTVAAVSRTALSATEFTDVSPANAGAEPVYRVTVNLASQTVNAYGQPHQLQVGMVIEADVILETRRLYEWVLEPLFTLTGKVH